MLGRLRTAVVAGAFLASLLVPLGAAGSAHADAATTCEPQGTIAVNSGEYTLQANEWNSSAQQCVTSNGGTAWSVSTADFGLPTNGAPATYPSLYKGCHWGACTSGSGLPIQVSDLADATSSWSTVQPASGAYDVAYDIWINSTPTTSGQPDGTEIMVWLNSRGGVQPFGSQTGTSTAAGYNWNVWTGQQTSWKIISYVLQGGGTSFSNLDVKALIDDAVARGSVNPANYLIDAEAGFEIWQGGQGLATNSFSFDATANSGTGGGTGGGGTGGGTGTGCTAALAVTDQWSTGFTDTVTVTNTGSKPSNSWNVQWTWPDGQQLSSAWNASAAQSGGTVSASSLSYNNVIAPGASTTFGLQGTWSGSNGTPTLSCSST
ncbi:cellulose-binding protein [Streptacidiphilus sp. P02-A3a]|nr:cellulose-binding protein [Streptacidiphilus sp. P02-A3a]